MISLRAPLFLHVPFEQKEDAKALGARWSAERRQWYVPAGQNAEAFTRWMPGARTEAIALPTTLPLPTFENSNPVDPDIRVDLFVDLVPSSAWFSNLRSELQPAEWDAVKKKTYQLAGNRCQACGGRGPNHPVEAHERWEFNAVSGIQKLLRTIALCPACHEATHFGLANMNGRSRQAKDQLMKVIGLTEARVVRHIADAMEAFRIRSKAKWKLDARWLVDFVPLSEATTRKILDHVAGQASRGVEDWQAKRIQQERRRMSFLGR